MLFNYVLKSQYDFATAKVVNYFEMRKYSEQYFQK